MRTIEKIVSILLCAAMLFTLMPFQGNVAAAERTSSEENTMNSEVPRSIAFTDVKVTDDFWGSRQKQMVCVTVLAGITNVERAGGGVSNIINTAKMHRGEAHGEQAGALYVDSDVHKLLEAICYALQLDAAGDTAVLAAQAQISAKLEEWIPYYQDAQEESGYFDTYFTLAHPTEKWTDFNKHELYCAGHFYEAAVAHYRMTGGADTRLFDMAVKNADYVESLFGVGKWKQVPGHQEIELALLKLANLCREIGTKNGIDYAAKAEKYVALAKFFLDTRGDQTGRHGINLSPDMCQDAVPLTEQKTALSHAVRAGYMYSAMADVTLQSGDNKYIDALLGLWDSVNTKTYVTGGVGDTEHHEGFGPDYYMPLDKSYCETCAGIANMMWNQRMNLLFGESKYADKVETALYNTVLCGINLDGNRFFYNDYISTGGRERVEWYGTACCPPNLMRTVLSLGGYIYAQQGNQITMNLYIGNEANLTVADGAFKLNVTAGFPADGNTRIEFRADGSREMTLRLRVPEWAKGTNMAKLNGADVSATPDADGYITITRVWQNGDNVELIFPMQVQAIDMIPGVTYTENYTAFRRGPIVYAAEKIDNEYAPKLYYIPGTASFTETAVENLDGKDDPFGLRGVLKITTQDAFIHTLDGEVPASLTMLPFYAVSNRGSTAMEVYISTISRDQTLEFYATASASYTNSGNRTDSVLNLNDGNDADMSRWTSYDGGNVRANPWVQYDFTQEVMLSACSVHWYDDGGGVQVPNGLDILWWNGVEFVPVSPTHSYIAFPKNAFATYSFEPVVTSKIRLVMHNDVSGRACGIVEWQLIGTRNVSLRKCVWDAESIASGFNKAGFSSYGTGIGSTIDAVSVPGKGAAGGNALAYRYLQYSDAGDMVLQLDTSAVAGFQKEWSGGELLWFYADASEYENPVTFGITLDWVDLAPGQQVLLWKGSGEPTDGGKSVEIWDGRARVRLPAGYKGFVGIPLSGYTAGGNVDLSNVNTVVLYYPAADASGSYPKNLYLDEFWITEKGSVPGIALERTKYNRFVWDMEQLSLPSAAVSTWGGFSLGEYVDATAEAGRGVNGSTALGYKYCDFEDSSKNGSFALQIETGGMTGFVKDWSEGEMFWYWVDASEFTHSFDLGIQLDWVDISPNQPVTFWRGFGEPYSGGVTKNIWDNHARVTVSAGYKGFIGIPLNGYTVGGTLNRSDVYSVVLYFCPSEPMESFPRTLYLDAFCITDAFSTPDISVEPEPVEPVSKKIWDAETAPDPFNTSTILTHYNDVLSAGLCEAVITEGKGYDGKKGFGYVLNGPWNDQKGDNNLNFTNLSAVGFITDWSGADTLWFWVDMSGYTYPVKLRLIPNWCFPAIGVNFRGWDGTGAPRTLGQTEAAWGGCDYGAFPLPAGYRGFVGVPLQAFAGLSLADVNQLVLYIDSDSRDREALPRTGWFDEFWVTAGDGVPELKEVCVHDYQPDAAGSVAPTCTDAGKTVYVCSKCGDSYEEPAAALGHDFVNGVCIRCGAEDPERDPCEGYTDINRALWYHSAADYVIQNGYMGSTKTDALTFEPNTKVSRAMVASIMYRIAGSPGVVYRASFTDVKQGKWYTAAIEWAAQNGLAAGKGSGKFDPSGNVTRQELAVFMNKLAAYLGEDVSASSDISGFPDAGSVPAWAKNYVAWAVAAGLISGKSSGGVAKLAPADNATRAEFASIIMRFMAA